MTTVSKTISIHGILKHRSLTKIWADTDWELGPYCYASAAILMIYAVFMILANVKSIVDDL